MRTFEHISSSRGSRLAFDPADAEQGIWFTATDGTETKVESIALNKPAKLIFMVPTLPAGEYEVGVRVRFKGSKAVRKTTLRKILAVTSATPAS